MKDKFFEAKTLIGILACFIIAIPAWLLGKQFPIIGGPVFGILFGMILAFVLSIKRMTPNNEMNQRNFEEAYVDCYPPSDVNPDDAGSLPAGEDQ